MDEEKTSLRRNFILRLFIYVSLALLLIFSIFGHHHSGAYQSTPTTRCINNLKMINAAAKQFALEHHLTNGEAIHFPNDLTPYIKLNAKGQIPSCPTSGKPYRITKVGETPTCSLGSTVTPTHVLP